MPTSAEHRPGSLIRSRGGVLRWYAGAPLAKALYGIVVIAAMAIATVFYWPAISGMWESAVARPGPTITVEAESTPAPTITVVPTGIASSAATLSSSIARAQSLLAANPKPDKSDAHEWDALNWRMGEAQKALDDPYADSAKLDSQRSALDQQIASFEANVKWRAETAAAQQAPAPAPEQPAEQPAAPEPEPVQEPVYQEPAPAPAPAPVQQGATWSISCTGDAVATVVVDGSSQTTTGGSGTYYSSFSYSYYSPSGAGSCG